MLARGRCFLLRCIRVQIMLKESASCFPSYSSGLRQGDKKERIAQVPWLRQ